MAAIAYPEPSRRPQRPVRRHLTVVPDPVRQRRPRSRSAIYRRRRVAVFVGLVVLMFLMLVAARPALGALGGGPLAAPGAPAGRGGASAVYVVQPGDTYWSIARRLQPSGDVRALVDRLSTEHAGAPLQPGEQLTLR